MVKDELRPIADKMEKQLRSYSIPYKVKSGISPDLLNEV